MKRASFLLLGMLMLGACTPTMQAPTTPPDSFGGGFKPIGTPPTIWFISGTAEVFDLVVTVKGSNLRVNAPEWCKVTGPDIICTVPTLLAGQNFVLPAKGSNLSALATYTRANGISYSSMIRQ